jgi:SAM-dependent methyltransferase
MSYVQYGCGLSTGDSWINFDNSPTLRLQRLPIIGWVFKLGNTGFPESVRYGDIVAGLPVPDHSADGVYASHVLEHLSYEEFWLALQNTYAVLKPGGIFRLIVPDLENRTQIYLRRLSEGNADANSWLMDVLAMTTRRRDRSIVGALRRAFGGSEHRWMWDEASMSAALRKVGFAAVRRCQFNDSADETFKQVENRSRYYDSNQDIVECAMEARKP